MTNLDLWEQMLKKEIHFVTDREQEVIEGLKLWHLMLKRVEQDPYFWKWAIVVLHNALLATVFRSISEVPSYLGGRGYIFIREWCDWLDELDGVEVMEGEEEIYYERHLDSLPRLYNRMKRYLGYRPPSNIDGTVIRFHMLRNEFIRHKDLGCARPAKGLLRISIDCFQIIMFLALEKIEWERPEILSQIVELEEKTSALLAHLKSKYDAQTDRGK